MAEHICCGEAALLTKPGYLFQLDEAIWIGDEYTCQTCKQVYVFTPGNIPGQKFNIDDFETSVALGYKWSLING
jgi:hypothetical protein